MDASAVTAFTCPVKTNSGNRALEHLPLELAGLNALRPLIVTDTTIVGRKALRILTGAFGDSGMTLGVFDGIGRCVDLAAVDSLKRTCLEEKYDSLIALGGGAIVDAAKVLNLALSMKIPDARKLTTHIAPEWRPLPLAVIPTAGADGLETSFCAHFGGRVYASPQLAPMLVVIDPRLTASRDAATIAVAGLAALGRALEAQGAVRRNPFRDAYSCSAIGFIAEHLPGAVRKPGDKKASLAVINAAAMSGCAFSNSDGRLLHKLGRLFHELYRIHPGLVMAMCLPAALRDFRSRDDYDLSVLLQPLAGDDLFARTAPEERADAALAFVDRFIDDLYAATGDSLPRTLRQAGLPRYVLEDALKAAGKDSDGPRLVGIIEAMWDKPGT